MKIITFLAQKGGTGKTTLILSVAVAWAKSGMSVMVVDTDPQKSAANWFERRDPDLQEQSPFVIYTEAKISLKMIRKYSGFKCVNF